MPATAPAKSELRTTYTPPCEAEMAALPLSALKNTCSLGSSVQSELETELAQYTFGCSTLLNPDEVYGTLTVTKALCR